MIAFHLWGQRALWALLAIASIYALTIFVGDYAACRQAGHSNIACFVVGLFFAYVKMLLFALAAAINLLVSLLP